MAISMAMAMAISMEDESTWTAMRSMPRTHVLHCHCYSPLGASNPAKLVRLIAALISTKSIRTFFPSIIKGDEEGELKIELPTVK